MGQRRFIVLNQCITSQYNRLYDSSKHPGVKFRWVGSYRPAAANVVRCAERFNQSYRSNLSSLSRRHSACQGSPRARRGYRGEPLGEARGLSFADAARANGNFGNAAASPSAKRLPKPATIDLIELRRLVYSCRNMERACRLQP